MAYTNIDKPSDYFNTKLYTGTGATHNITGVGFQPDWVWIKSRSQAVNHYGYDSVRGTDKRLQQNITNAESTTDTTWFNSFDSDGFTIGSEANINNSSSTYASWNWLAGGSASSNTDGSITSSVSANTTAGFSIVSWTNASDGDDTVGHGLNSAPEIIITKKRSTTNDWYTYTTVIDGSYDYLALNTTSAKSNSTKTAPTSSVFTTDMGDTSTAIAYAFHSVKGYSKFGSYTGNGNADGTFVYTGFKPAFVIIKQTNASGEGWHILDNKRSGANGDMERLLANSSNAESNYSGNLDLLSNGFKTRINDAGVNGSSASYIYMAFAEASIVGTNNVPANAR